MGGGAWPFLVGGVICLVNSVNERDHCLLNSPLSEFSLSAGFLEGRAFYQMQEDSGYNRSVMPLDVLGRTRATLMHSTSFTLAERPGQPFKRAS
jgi:hypothetical protein